MNNPHLERLADRIFDSVKSFVVRRVDDVKAAVVALTTDVEAVKASTAVLATGIESHAGALARLADEIKAIPAGPPGPAGPQGADAPPPVVDYARLAEVVRPDVEAEVAAAVAGLPVLQGPPGEKGDPGAAGASVGIEDVLPVIEREVAERVAALTLPAGPAGPDGPRGAPGEKGADGRDGRDGRAGAPGRDALEIDILPRIDERRQYARGTFAQHDGGIIRALRVTDPITDGDIESAGWAVVVRGIAAFDVVQGADLRSFEVTFRATGGGVQRCAFVLPALLDRGVYKAGTDYVAGDGATFGGSFWIAQRATADKPGTSDAWRLAVKRGADGRDAAPAPPVGPVKVSIR